MAISEVKAGAILSYVAIAVNNIVGILYTPYMLRMLGQNEYGLYSLVASVVAYLTLLDLGFGNAIIRYTSQYRVEGKTEEQYEMFGMFFKLYCCIGIVAFIIGIILLFNIKGLFDNTMSNDDIYQTQIMMLLMLFNIAFTFPMSIWGAILSAYEKFVFQKAINIARVILNAIVMIFLLYLGYKAISMVVVLTIFNILTLCMNAWYCKKKLKIKIKFSKIKWQLIKEIFNYSIWIFIAGIVDRIYWSSGQFVLGIYRPPTEIAVFGVAVQLQAIFFSFAYAISNVFLPRLVRMVNTSDDNTQLSSLLTRVGRLQFYILSLLFSGFVIFGRRFLILWAGEDYIEAYPITLLFLFVHLITSIQTLGYNILQAKNRIKFRSLSILVISLLALIACFPMAKNYGGIGCAICVTIGIFVAQILVINVYYQFCIGLDIVSFWKNIFQISIVPIIITIVGALCIKQLDSSSILIYVSSIIIYSIVFSMSLYYLVFNNSEKQIVSPLFKKIKGFIKK